MTPEELKTERAYRIRERAGIFKDSTAPLSPEEQAAITAQVDEEMQPILPQPKPHNIELF